MRIIDNFGELTRLEHIDQGQVFGWDNRDFIKSNRFDESRCEFFCVCLEDGFVASLHPSTMVRRRTNATLLTDGMASLGGI